MIHPVILTDTWLTGVRNGTIVRKDLVSSLLGALVSKLPGFFAVSFSTFASSLILNWAAVTELLLQLIVTFNEDERKYRAFFKRTRRVLVKSFG